MAARAQDAEWQTLSKEAMSLYQTGQYDRAVSLGSKALDVAEKALGPDHPDTAQLFYNFAVIYSAHGGYAQAEPLKNAGSRSGRPTLFCASGAPRPSTLAGYRRVKRNT